MIKIVKTHRKPRRSKFYFFSSFAWFELKFAAEMLYVVNFAICYFIELNKVNFGFLLSK